MPSTTLTLVPACVVCDGLGCEMCPAVDPVEEALEALGRDARRARLEALWNMAQAELANARLILARPSVDEALRTRHERRAFLFASMLTTLRDELDELRAAS